MGLLSRITSPFTDFGRGLFYAPTVMRTPAAAYREWNERKQQDLYLDVLGDRFSQVWGKVAHGRMGQLGFATHMSMYPLAGAALYSGIANLTRGRYAQGLAMLGAGVALTGMLYGAWRLNPSVETFLKPG